MPRQFATPAPYSTEARPAISLHPVESSQVKAIGYDPSTKTLAVQFQRGAGAIYHYSDVTQEQFDAFRGAESIGTHFGKHIKPLPFTKFTPDGDPQSDENGEKAAAA